MCASSQGGSFDFPLPHEIDGLQDRFRDTLRGPDIGGGRELIEGGERPFGGQWREVFHDGTIEAPAAAPQRTETSRFCVGRLPWISSGSDLK